MEDIKHFILSIADESDIKKTSNKKKRRPSRNKNKPWFDDECQNIKSEITKLGNMLRRNPNDVGIREKLYIKKRDLRNLARNKRTSHRSKIIDEICNDMSNKDMKKYWKHLRKLEDSSDENIYIPDITMINHFKELLQTDENKIIVNQETTTTELGNLDFPITQTELNVASKILKAGKGTGIDTIRNEMISPLIEAYPSLVLRAFNDIIINNKPLCRDWLHSLITAIHKKGSKDDPGNYRGISLMSCLGKLFLTIINNRLVKYSLDNGLLSPGQLGFVIGNRTSDPHIILHNLIQKYCHKKNQESLDALLTLARLLTKYQETFFYKNFKTKELMGESLIS